MATLYGVNATKRLVSNEKLATNSEHGRMRVAYDKYVAAGNMTAGDVINMGKLPKGARVVGYWLKSSDLGTTGAANLGWSASVDAVEAADADGFFATVDLNAAAISIGTSDQENMVGLGKEFNAEVEIQLTLTANTTAAGTVESCIMYVCD